MKRLGFVLLGALLLCSCAMLEKPEVVGPSFATAKGGPPAGFSDPVWILPEIRTADVMPEGDETEWRSGYQTATVVEPGRWSTREEAELLGVTYIDPNRGNTIVPEAVPASAPSQTLNATTLSQELVELADRQGGGGTSTAGSSDVTSVPSTALVPTFNVDAAPAPSPVPPMPSAPLEASPESTPPSLPSPPPRVGFSTETNELLIYPGGGDGMSLSSPTPLGPVLLEYSAGKITVDFQGRSITVDQPKSEDLPARVSLSQ